MSTTQPTTNLQNLSTNEIYEILENEIVTLILEPGTYLSETEVSKRFNVSRTPIRDAFKRLEFNNLIKVVPQKFTYVTPIDLDRLAEFMFMREKLEIGIIEEFIINLDPYKFAQIELMLIAQRRLVEDTSIETILKARKFFELDNDFHKMLYQLAAKESIWYNFNKIMPDYQRFRAIAADIHTEEDIIILLNHHNDIVKCLKNKKFDEVKKIYQTHIHSGKDKISNLIKLREHFFVVN